MKFQCTECNEECPKRQKESHSCIQVLKGKIDFQQKLIDHLFKINGLSTAVVFNARPKNLYTTNLGNGRLIEMSREFDTGKDNPIYCGKHNETLRYTRSFYDSLICDACRDCFGKIAKEKNRELRDLDGLECQLYSLHICEYCLRRRFGWLKR